MCIAINKHFRVFLIKLLLCNLECLYVWYVILIYKHFLHSPEEKEEKASTEGEGEIVKSKMEDKEEEEATAEHEGEEGEDSAVHPSLALTRKGSIEDTVRESPGFCFITRPDLYKFAKVSCYQL